MKKTVIRISCIIIALMMLIAILPINVFADAKAPIDTVVATSDFDEVATLYNRTRDLNFEVTEGAPIRFSQSWTTCWEIYNEETDQWENYKGRFYPGRYRVYAQIRLDGEDAYSHMIDENVTCTVDGNVWTVESVSNHSDFSSAFVISQEIVIVDDPSVSEPVDIENVYFNLSGYVDGGRFSETTLEPHLGK